MSLIAGLSLIALFIIILVVSAAIEVALEVDRHFTSKKDY